jgi:hypothetical protein
MMRCSGAHCVDTEAVAVFIFGESMPLYCVARPRIAASFPLFQSIANHVDGKYSNHFICTTSPYMPHIYYLQCTLGCILITAYTYSMCLMLCAAYRPYTSHWSPWMHAWSLQTIVCIFLQYRGILYKDQGILHRRWRPGQLRSIGVD